MVLYKHLLKAKILLLIWDPLNLELIKFIKLVYLILEFLTVIVMMRIFWLKRSWWVKKNQKKLLG